MEELSATNMWYTNVRKLVYTVCTIPFVFAQKFDKFWFVANGIRTVRRRCSACSQSCPHIPGRPTYPFEERPAQKFPPVCAGLSITNQTYLVKVMQNLSKIVIFGTFRVRTRTSRAIYTV